MQPEAKEFMKAQLQELQETVNTHGGRTGKSAEMRHYLCDHLGVPNGLLNNCGEVKWLTTLDAWGRVKEIHEQKKEYQPIRLPGQHEDRTTGVYYNRYRYFDLEMGVYASQDPLGIAAGWNISLYPLNSLQKIDPLGLHASLGIFTVDQSATLNVLVSEAGLVGVATINRGQIWADSKVNQTAARSFMHAMRNADANQSASDACKQANDFIEKIAAASIEEKNKGNTDKSLFLFGVALHVLQDSTSVSHVGFQPWSDSYGYVAQAAHAVPEAIMPADEDHPLYTITRDAWKAYQSNNVSGFKLDCKCGK